MSQNGNYSYGGGEFNYNGSTSKNTQQQYKQSQDTENIKTNLPRVTSQRRLRFKPQTQQSGKNFKKKIEVINKSAKVFSEVFQKEVSAFPHLKFVRNSEAIDDSEDEDDDDDSSSVYSSTNDILSQPGDTFCELSQDSSSDSFYNLSQPDYNSTRKIRQLPATKLPFLIPQLYQPKCAIFWDIENCPLPSGKSAIHFVKNMRDTHCKDHTEDKFLVVCDTTKLAAGVSLDLQNSLVKLEHVSGKSKNAADECLRRNMREFAENNVAPVKIVIITGDINFNSELHDMRYKRHFNVVLIHNRQTSEALKALASECHQFEEFCMNLPEGQTNQNTGPVIVQVNNLPHNVERRRVHGRLARLVKIFGGKILNLNDYKAYVQFSSRNDAIRAQSSLRGEDVHGSKIALHVVTRNTERNCTDESKISDKRTNENKNEGEEEPKQNVEVEQNRNTCFVSFCVNESMSFNQLRSTIQKEIDKVESLELHSREGNKNCYLMKCESLNWGIKAVKSLNQMKNPQLYDVQFLRNKSDGGIQKISTVEEIAVLAKCVGIQQSCLDKHKTKMTELRKRLSSPPSANEVFVSQKRYNILFDIEKEFQQATNGLLDSIKNASKTNDPEVKILFEASQISRACPVYAYRSKIVQSFTINPVTILTGIPGSGKSTQVVQYIFQEMSRNNGSNNWKIVCTQPHKSLVTKIGSIVESQMKNSIGYELGNEQKLVFVTEHSLFSECVSNNLLDGITHVLIDEAQERNLFTQLLLAYIKMILPKRKDLHLLVTTTPDCADTFSNFFHQCEIIKIDYPNYPVEIIREIPHQNYVKAAVTKALRVLRLQELRLEENGDILVFLPNAFDVNFAFEVVAEKLRTRKDVKVHKLLLTYNFDQTYKNVQHSTSRNIIFTTGEEEKIISLPNVRFVVDSGLSTEFRCEINHKLVETKFITLSSAEFRATAAGVSSPGKCYRFYSLEKLSGINDEITAKLNTDLLVLCTLSLGINPNLFDFFSPLPKEKICESLKKLEKINAVEKNVITLKGRLLIQFPLSLHLSNILLEGIARRIDYETLCFVAVSSTMHMYTVLTPETSNLKMKNTMELLKNYMEWYGKSSVERENFLTKIKINVRDTMKIINQKVIELHSVLKETFPSFLLQSTNSSWKFQLEKLIATCWMENLCILKHDNVYLWKLQKKVIHVLSSFASRDDCPSCLIFESLLKMRAGEYITNFIPLDKNVVENDENFGMVNRKKKSMREEEIIVRSVGYHILSTGFLGSNGNLKVILEKKLSQSIGSTVEISVCQSKGEIKIRCGERDKEKVRDEIGKKIEKIQKKMTKELWEFCICEQTGMRLVWGEKAQVVQFLMPSDFLTVIVFAPPIMSTDEIIHSFNKYGKIVHYNEKITYNKKKQINIMFDNPTSAKHAVAHEEKGLTTKPRLENVCQQNKMQYFVELKIQWTRRLNLGSATIEFDKYPSYLYGKIKCYTLKKYDGCRFTLQNLDLTLSKEEVVSKIEADLSDTDIKIKNCNLLLEPGFQTTLEDLNEIKGKLNSLVMPILGENDVDIFVEEPNLNDDIWTATVFFNDFKLLRLLLNSIRKKTLDGRRLFLTVNYFCCVFCGRELFDTVKNDFQLDLKKIQTNVEKKIGNVKVETTAVEDSGKIAVEIVGDDFDKVIFRFQCLSTRLRSYTFNMSDYVLLREKFYDDDERQEMLNKLSKNANAFVGYNKFSNQISVIDNPQVVGNVSRQLQLEIANSDFLDEVEFSCNSPSGTIRELVKSYNPKLTGLKKITGVVHVELNITLKNIKVKGDNEAVNKIKGILESIKFKLNTSKPSNVKKDSIDKCPICSDDVDKANYNYRMEMCGHFYCFPCVTALIANSNPPICCLFKGCSKPIVFRDLTYFYQKCPLVVRNLVDKTTFQYFKKNMDGFLFCVLPDCDGILSRADEENYCVKCFNKICIRCEVIYHYGQTCEEYKKKYPKTITQKCQVEFNAVPLMVSTNVTPEKPKKRYSFDEIIQKSQVEFDAASSTKVTAEKPNKTDPEIIQTISGSKSKLPIIFPALSLEDFTMEVPIEENTCIKFNKKPHNDDPGFHSSSIFSREKSDPFLKSASEYNSETKKQTASKKLPPMCEVENSSITGDKTRQSISLIGESSNRPTSLTGTSSSSSPGVGYLPPIEACRSSGINSNSYSSNYANSTRVNSTTVKSEDKYSNSKRENYSNQKFDSNTFGRPKPPKKDDTCMMM